MDDNDNENILRESLKPLLASSFSVELIGRPRRTLLIDDGLACGEINGRASL